MHPRLISVGNFALNSYGALLALGFFLGYLAAVKASELRRVDRGFIESAVTGAVVSGIIAARLAYILISPAEFLSNPLRMVMFWEGGLVFLGGLAGGGAWVLYICRKKGVRVFEAGDVLAPALALGHGFGRIGCFLAGCCWGVRTDMFVGVDFSRTPGTLCTAHGPVHPVQLYSAVFLISLSFYLYGRLRRRAREGAVLGQYLLAYPFFRFFIEFIRGDYRGDVFMSLTPTQWVSIAAMCLGILIFKKTRGRER